MALPPANGQFDYQIGYGYIPDWPGDFTLDASTAAKRSSIATIANGRTITRIFGSGAVSVR